MLQGLVIRQAFLIIDWVLAVLILVGVVFLAMSFLEKPAELAIPDASNVEGSPQSPLLEVQPRPVYDRFITSGFMGVAGETAAPPVAAPPVEVAETELKLKLRGTVATTPKDLFASATIFNDEDKTINTYAVGQEVIAGVKLEEIHQRKVILFNSNSNRREVLRSDEEEAGATTAVASAGKPASNIGPGKRITVKKNELVQEVFMNYADLVGKIKPEMYYDSNGKVAGITASNLESIPLASKLDIRNNDVLQSVNNEPIDSEAKIMELVNKYRNSNMVRIGILRDGKPMTVTYRLE